ncbi:MAG: MFS transporter [Bryobacteraceae bacterium]|nr:MFS transporter [Bryobacteraceae bacterium]
MRQFWSLLRRNRNYRYAWLGQTVSEVGDHFNTIAVLSLALRMTGSGFTVGLVMLARILPALLAGPVAGVILDRYDRRKVMIASDLFRAGIALLHVLLLTFPSPGLMYLLSALLMFASPFFNAGRSAILPNIAGKQDLHTANALTQTTAWLTLTIGTMLGGVSTAQFGYEWAFVANAFSFLVSAWAIWRIASPEGHFRPVRSAAAATTRVRFQGAREFMMSLRYMRSRPLIFGIALTTVGWASGGGAAQVLFTLFGEIVYNRGPAGVGLIWGFAGIGLVMGGLLGHRLGERLRFEGYKRTLTISFSVHGVSYILFALMPTIWLSLIFITLSRVSMGLNNVLNRTMLLQHVPDFLRGRVFTTVEMMMHATMMLSLGAASWASSVYPIRTIGVIAGALSASTALFWAWADATGRLTEPPRDDTASDLELAEPVTPS